MPEVLVPAIGAVLILVLQLRSQRREALRNQFAEALADVFRWRELPYRIRRRQEGRTPIVNMIHDLQERLLAHEAWLRVEAPFIHESYCALVAAVKEKARPFIHEAWTAPVIDSDEGMNLSPGGEVDIEDEVRRYLADVELFLRGYWYQLWR